MNRPDPESIDGWWRWWRYHGGWWRNTDRKPKKGAHVKRMGGCGKRSKRR